MAGERFEAKLTAGEARRVRDEMRIPFTDAQLEENPYQPPYYTPGENGSTKDGAPAATWTKVDYAWKLD